jgi:hypothetical protein
MSTLPNSAAAVNAADLTFGIEIECFIPSTALAAARVSIGGYHNGRQIPGLPAGWNAQDDISIDPESRDQCGVEIVSPILKGADGIAQVKAVVAWINSLGGKVNASCGLHVHIGFAGRKATELARLVCLVGHHEKALYAMTGTKTRERGRPGHRCYSASIQATHKSVSKTGLLSGSGDAGCDRYRVLNLTNLASGRRPTVEFRCFAGTLNILKVLASIQVCLGLVQKALTGKTKARFEGEVGVETGVQAVGRLFNFLYWRFETKGVAGPWRPEATDGAYRALGILDPETLAAAGEKCLEMARKYDAA